MDICWVLGLSMALQLCAGVAAFWLARVSRWRAPWGLIGVASFLAAIRLGVVCVHLLQGRDPATVDTLSEYVFLAYSACLAPGLLLIAPRLRDVRSGSEALREGERRLSTLLSNLPGMAYRCRNDRDWTMEFVSEGCRALTGFGPQELVGNRKQSYGDVIVPDDRDDVWRSVQEGVESDSPFRLRYRIRRADGEVRWVWEQGTPVRDANGELIALEGFIADVTDARQAEERLRHVHGALEERVAQRTADLAKVNERLLEEIRTRERTEEALRESEQRLQGILDNSPAVIYAKDHDGRYILVNRQFEQIFELKRESIVGRDDFALFDEAAAGRFRRNDLEVLKSDRAVEFEEVAPQVDGMHTYISLKFPLRDAQGRAYAVCGISTDITDRKRSEEALRESERKLRAVIESAPLLLFASDRDGILQYMAGSFIKEHPELRVEEWIGKSGFELWKEHPQVPQNWRRALAGEEFTDEVLFDRTLWETRYVPYRDNQGEVAGFIGVSIDITDRKRAEELARAHHEEVQSILDLAPVMIWFKDPENRILRANRAAAEAIGLSVEELEGRSTYELYGEHAYKYHQDDLEVIRSGRPKLGIIEKNRFADGSDHWVRTDKAPFVDKNGVVTGVIVVAQDITARIQAEEALRESSQKLSSIAQELQTLLAHTRDFVYRRDRKGSFVYVSPSVEQITGYTPADWRVQYPRVRTTDPLNDRVDHYMEKTLESGEEGPPYLMEIRHRDGRLITLEVNERPFTEEGIVAGVIGVARDVTERVRAGMELEKAKEAAEAASRAKSVFLANLSHEIRTPIMAMLGAAELENGDAHRVGPVNQREIILRNGRYLLSLINDLLDVARVESNTFEVRPAPCPLLEVFADAYAVTAPLVPADRVDYRIQFDSEIPSHVRTDATRLRQAIINLVNNAIKATPEGRVTVSVRVDRGPSPALVIEVSDTGVGIPPESLDRVFELFTQLGTSPAGIAGGVGLGLPLTRRIAEALGGGITAQSAVGRGSTFTLRVSCDPVDNAAWISPEGFHRAGRSSPAFEPSLSSTALSGRVLLAEDFDDTRILIETALTAAGARVVAVADGRTAVEEALRGGFDLILLDIRMPELDGMAAAEEIRRSGCCVAMIALTASTDPVERDRVLSAGFDEVWFKPISLRELVSRAESYLGGAVPGKTAGAEAPSGGDARSAGEIGGLPRVKLSDKLEAVAREFSRSLPSRVARLRVAVEGRDEVAAREALHQLVGSSGIFGLQEVSAECLRLQQLLRGGGLAGRPGELSVLTTLADNAAHRARVNGE